MSVEIITKEDLNKFKLELLSDLKEILNSNPKSPKKWLRSKEVEKMLAISPATLQNYRISGVIKFSKVGSTYYYDQEQLLKLLNKTTLNYSSPQV